MSIHQEVAAVDVVVVNWNSGHHLAACVGALAAIGDRSVLRTVMVVDNGSTDRSLEIPLPVSGLVWIDRAGKNLGFAAGSNRGARQGTAPYILFLNPDAAIHDGALSAALAAFGRSPQIGIVGLRLLDAAGETSRTCSRFPTVTSFLARALGLDRVPGCERLGPFMQDFAHRSSRSVDQVMGACFLMPRALFERLGGFDERFFLYYEDVDLALRLRHAGLASWFEAAASARHVGGGSSAGIPARRLYYLLSSRLAYTRKHFGDSAHIAVFLLTVLIEPWSRLIMASARHGTRGAADVINAYGLLVKHLFIRADV